MGDRRGRLKRQSARVSGQGSQNLYSKLQFLRVFWWLFLWFGDSFRSKLSNYFVFCTKVMFLFTSIFYPIKHALLTTEVNNTVKRYYVAYHTQRGDYSTAGMSACNHTKKCRGGTGWNVTRVICRDLDVRTIYGLWRDISLKCDITRSMTM